MKTSQYYLYLIVLFSFFWLQAQDSSTTPNFIFYLADDQDLLDYGVYGNPKVHTPAVDALAKEGCASQIFTLLKPFVRQVVLKFLQECIHLKMAAWPIICLLSQI